jgi:hypothetical protein
VPLLRPVSWLQDEGAPGVDCRHQLWLVQDLLAYRLYELGSFTWVMTIDLERAFPSTMREYVALALWYAGCRGAFLGQGLLLELPESTRLPHRRRMRRRRVPTTRSTPRDLQGPICPRKKCAIWTRWRPVPVKNVNYPRAPSSRRSGLAGSHTTPTIVNYKYMASTPREGYFGLPALGT